MKGVVFLGDRKLELRQFSDPTPGARDVIIEIKASGMCGSDLHNYRASAQPAGAVTGGIRREAGVIAGHEPCGIVAAVGAGVTEKEARIGQRVMDHHYDGRPEQGWRTMTTDHGNSAEIAAWNGPLGRTWVDWPAAFDAVLEPIGAVTLARAEVRAGERVIDVGCGAGAIYALTARSRDERVRDEAPARPRQLSLVWRKQEHPSNALRAPWRPSGAIAEGSRFAVPPKFP